MLKIENLNLIFAKGTIEEKVIFENLNLNVSSEEFVIVIGGNGAGKSTLMNLISGSIKSDGGKIFIDGDDVTYLPEYKRSKYVGHLFQFPLKGTASGMTIEENLSLSILRNKKRTLKFGVKKKYREFFKEKLSQLNLNLENRLDTKMGSLSGGQRQAVALLMTTFAEPKILLLDEHTAALDPKASENILELTKKIIKDNKITTIMITHNLNEALAFGSRIIMFNNGKIEFDLKNKEKNQLSAHELAEMFKLNICSC